MLSDKQKSVLKKVFSIIFQIFIIGYLFYQLYEIGLAEIIESVPEEILFYILFIPNYFSLPLTEILIYRISWKFEWKKAFPIFIQKKVLNTDVVGYSGEFFLFHWAKTKLGIPTKEALNVIKDNIILSSLASTFITLLLLYYFLVQGFINLDDLFGGINTTRWLTIAVIVIVLSVVAYYFRNILISLNFKDSVKIFFVHSSRIILINVIQILQWKVAEPSIDLNIWFSLSAIQILTSRIPFLPSRDVLFVSLALEATSMVELSKGVLVGILTANLVMKRIFNIGSYAIASLYKSRYPVVNPNEKIPDI